MYIQFAKTLSHILNSFPEIVYRVRDTATSRDKFKFILKMFCCSFKKMKNYQLLFIKSYNYFWLLIRFLPKKSLRTQHDFSLLNESIWKMRKKSYNIVITVG